MNQTKETINGWIIKRCQCENVEMGSYDNQVKLKRPDHMPDLKIGSPNPYYLCIDKCIANEVQKLWNLGISTTGCCCGHNKIEGYIGVINSDIPKMINLGYDVHYNSNRPNDKDSFIPESINYD